MDRMTSLGLKSAFHHLTVFELHRAYQAFEVDGACYRYKATPFGTKHSPIFFTEAMIKIFTEDPVILKEQTLALMEILMQFGLTISMNKCELEPKQEIIFLGWTWNTITMEVFMTKDRRMDLLDMLKRLIKTTRQNKLNRVKYLTRIIEKLNFLRTQFKEASLYLMLLYQAQTRAAKEQGWNGMMKVTMQALPEIYWWMYRIFNNKRLSLRWSILLETLVTDASPRAGERLWN
ncbi:MAG: hypothetical protein EZS28_046198 [Streblomastix strix]|uniref:Reverse transcriptase domain-containing protein n=1 Tax=Streblomastix strix TaxID=222440 RepID=A0A5J4TIL3_9EUKA|nr:MAG: hypothetical protein EZS28_046198 [Streblomastix strix]